MELHKLLSRQLSHLELSETVLPPNPEQWQNFLKRINNFYTEADQERYLLERSMELSSREMMDLNEKLETAQHIAGLGYWVQDRTGAQSQLSKEIYRMFGLEAGTSSPTFDSLLELVHKEDRPVIEKLMAEAWEGQKGYECEIRIRNSENVYLWFYVIAHFHASKEGGTLSGTLLNITKRKQAEEEINQLHQQLVETARQAGMADVATSVLHNAGNILNSSNVSLNLIQEKMKADYYHKLFAALSMLKDHAGEMDTWLASDPKGKLIPPYLMGLSDIIQQEHAALATEIDNLASSLNHLKEVIAKQQDIGKVKNFKEKVYLPEIVDNAAVMCQNILAERNIVLNKNYICKPFITSDKSNLVQILINVIQNAKDAILENSQPNNKKINISVDQTSDGRQAMIAIEDSGIGISKEQLDKIFTWGFTTKPDGHGFGLHNCALKAREMGGTLKVDSEGEGKGALFTLYLPLDS